MATLIDLIKEVFVVGLSAFGGAWAAFLFESRRERKREEDKHYRAIMFAHFALLSQYQELITLRDSYFGEFGGRPDAWFRLHPATLGFASPSLNLSELGFVLEGSDPDLLNRLTVGQQRYENVRSVIEFRNQAHMELQRRAAGEAVNTLGFDASAAEEELGRILGKDVVAHLVDSTTELFNIHRTASSLLEENLSGISKFVSAYFPDRKPPKFEVLPKDQRG